MIEVYGFRRLLVVSGVNGLGMRLQKRQRFRRQIGAGQPGAFAFDQDTQIHQIFKERPVKQRGIVAHDRGQRFRRCRFHIFRNESALSRNDPQKAHAGEIEHPLIHRAAADPKLGGKLPFRRNTVAGLEFTGQNTALHNMDKICLAVFFIRGGHGRSPLSIGFK